MTGRTARHATTLVAGLVAVTLLPHNVGAANDTSRPLFSLAALLTVAPDLPPLSRSVLVAEAERIWRREGVTLQWPRARGHEAPTALLRVLVITRREAVTTGTHREWTVGELVPHAGQRALAIASIAGAERVLAEASGSGLPLLDTPDFARYRLGVVLGRAVAHEIGHYLLATATHADRGLMRAAIGAREFADPTARTFALDDTAGNWLRDQLRTQPTDRQAPSSFTYTPTP
jgi:hypothetical protein